MNKQINKKPTNKNKQTQPTSLAGGDGDGVRGGPGAHLVDGPDGDAVGGVVPQVADLGRHGSPADAAPPVLRALAVVSLAEAHLVARDLAGAQVRRWGLGGRGEGG